VTDIYFVQGSEIRLNVGYNHYLKNIEKNQPSSLMDVPFMQKQEKPIFILSGCSMINPNPEITEARLLEQKLKQLDRHKRIPQENIIINERGIERLGCFLEAKQTLEELNIEKPKIYMPIETLYNPSYRKEFQRITGTQNIETLPIPLIPTPMEKISEFLISKAICLDTKNMNQSELIKYIEGFKYYNDQEIYDSNGWYSMLWKAFEIKTFN
jgi:hypothetical protein